MASVPFHINRPRISRECETKRLMTSCSDNGGAASGEVELLCIRNLLPSSCSTPAWFSSIRP